MIANPPKLYKPSINMIVNLQNSSKKSLNVYKIEKQMKDSNKINQNNIGRSLNED